MKIIGKIMRNLGRLSFLISTILDEVSRPTTKPPIISAIPSPPIKVFERAFAKPEGKIRKGNKLEKAYSEVAILIWYCPKEKLWVKNMRAM